jgi:signal transduction histidine kinase
MLIRALEGAIGVSESPRHRGSPVVESGRVALERAPEPIAAPPALPRVLAALVLVEGIAVIVGWAIENDNLKSVVPGLVSMKVNTAGALAALGAAILAPWKWLKTTLGLLVIVVAAASLIETQFNLDFGIDEFFVKDTDVLVSNVPGRMAPATGVGLVALGLAIVAPRFARRTILNGGPALALFFGYLAILGYAYKVEEFYAVTPGATMALHTAVAVTLLALAVNIANPEGALFYVATSARPGAAMLRRITPVAGLVVPVIGYLLFMGEDAGWYDNRSTLAKLAAFSALLLLITAGLAARSVDRIDDQRLRYQGELLALTDSLEQGLNKEWQRAETLVHDLARQQDLFERAISKVDDQVWTVEIVGPGVVRKIYESPSGDGIFGGSLPEGVNFASALAELVDPDFSGAFEEFNERVTNGLPAEVELRVEGFDGVDRWLWLRGVPRTEGERHFFDGITTNVTERRRLADQQAELLRAEVEHVRQLRELNRVREEFVATASHELRTPLTVIQGFAELLLSNEEIVALAGNQLETIQRRAMHLAHLVDDMFDLTKFNAGLVTLTFQTMELGSILEDDVANLQPAAADAGLELAVGADEGTAEIDLMRFHQALDNVIGNALKYTPRGGSVSVEGRTEGDRYVISVVDTGVGVGADQLELIFDPHFRAKTATDQAIPGTGLGLAITKAIVEAHGGTITARNGTGHGLEVTMVWPLAATARELEGPLMMAEFAATDA